MGYKINTGDTSEQEQVCKDGELLAVLDSENDTLHPLLDMTMGRLLSQEYLWALELIAEARILGMEVSDKYCQQIKIPRNLQKFIHRLRKELRANNKLNESLAQQDLAC